MAVDTTQSWQEHTSDGSTAYFPFNFNYDTTRPGTIVVGKRTADNTYSVVDASNYELIPNAAGDGGQIRFIQNPSGSQVIDDIPPAGTIVRIERVSVDTSSATWQIGLEMSELVNLFDRLFRLVQENKGGFDNVIKTFETQHNVSLYELLSAHNNHLLYWDNTTHTLTPTDFPKEDVVRCVNGLFFRISTTQAEVPYLEWSVNGSSDWHSSSVTWGTIGGNINDQTDLKNALDAKQNTISDLSTIRSGAAKGATAIQPGDDISELNNDSGYITGISSSMVVTALGYTPVNPSSLATVATTGSYNDLSDKPTIPTTLAGLTGDVSISNPTNGQSLQYDAILNKWKNVSSTVSIGFDGITGSPEDNVALKNALDLKADVATTYTKTEVDTALSGKANKDMNNLTDTGKNIANWSSNVSNCITEIPQDIKLELNNGTLTLKAGSKVYVPNGAGVFNTITVSEDKTATNGWGSANVEQLVFLRGNSLHIFPKQYCFSGTTAPTSFFSSNYATWYDTTNNVVKFTTNAGSTWESDISLPVGIIKETTGDVISNIVQIFNGFGYIDSTVFVLPNVKYLVPNGRNADGTLNNTAVTITSVKTRTFTDTATTDWGLGSDQSINQNPQYTLGSDNYLYATNGTRVNVCAIGILSRTNGVISSMTAKTAFHAVDYSDYAQTQSQVSTNTSDISAIIANTKSITAKDTLNSIVTTTGITKSQNGYVKLGNGIIIQWMTLDWDGSYTTLHNWATAFSATNSYMALAGWGNTQTDSAHPVTVREQTTTGVYLQVYTGLAGQGRKITVIGIGY